MILHAHADDWKLTANGDTPEASVLFTATYYLTDASGNYLTDASGNRLIVFGTSVVSPRLLHALADDWTLNAE